MGIQDRDYMRERARNRISGKRSSGLSDKTKAWITWSVLFFPMMIFANGAAKSWGWKPVLGILLVFLIASLFVARYVMGRSWHSIMWGDRK